MTESNNTNQNKDKNKDNNENNKNNNNDKDTNPLPAGYILVEGYPAIDNYRHLRVACSLTPKTAAQAAAAIKGSWYGVYVALESEPARAVAMGRVVGDGGWYFLISDMATLPEHQRKGLGDVVLKRLLSTIERRAPKGMAYVTLVADPPGRRLYFKNGFEAFDDPADMPMGRLTYCVGPEI